MTTKPTQAQIEAIKGWILITREEINGPFAPVKKGPWFICWHEIFDTRIEAITFAEKNNWRKPYRAVHGQLTP